MKKGLLILCLMFLLSGCTIVRIDTTSIDNIINVILSKNNDLYNRVGKGYKYYVPRGVNYIDTTDLNEKLYSNGNYYYLYVDAINYYYQKEVSYGERDDVYYSRYINKNNKQGYLEIRELENEQYYVQFMYNYAKIEAMVDKDSLNEVVLNASYILSTIKFNDDVIALNLTEDYFTNPEEVYDIFQTNEENDNYNKLETAEELEEE